MKAFYMTIALCVIQLSGASESGIVGGNIAEPHSRKYMASLQSEKGNHLCGGFLVREDFVLTAAHCTCVTPKTVVLGAHDLKKKETSQQRIQIEEYFQHPDFIGGYEFDIMLLKLKQKATPNRFVETIRLPKTDKDIPAVQKCSVAGWGRTHPSHNSPASHVLREGVEQIQFNQECRHFLKDDFNPKQMICTRFNKEQGSVCQGDSGGPLICKNKAVGITAFTSPEDCSDPNYPHGFTKISSFLPWINKVMGKLGNASKPLNF